MPPQEIFSNPSKLAIQSIASFFVRSKFAERTSLCKLVDIKRRWFVNILDSHSIARWGVRDFTTGRKL
jgi:hypothetical protein